jgi:hypothetical protein
MIKKPAGFRPLSAAARRVGYRRQGTSVTGGKVRRLRAARYVGYGCQPPYCPLGRPPFCPLGRSAFRAPHRQLSAGDCDALEPVRTGQRGGSIPTGGAHVSYCFADLSARPKKPLFQLKTRSPSQQVSQSHPASRPQM